MRRHRRHSPSNVGLVTLVQLTTIIATCILVYGLDNYGYIGLVLFTVAATAVFFIPTVIQLLKR